ncbi:MAG: hypothetical protein WA738_03775 [Candidatus Angelobacter sp.]
MRTLIFAVAAAAGAIIGATAQSNVVQTDDPAKKLGVLAGQWQTEGTFSSGAKISTSLDCRWSPQGSFLICEQLVKMPNGDHRQLTVYSYSKDSGYSYVTLSDPGAKPTTGGIEIKGNLWTYNSSFAANGKTTQIRTTNEFTDAKTEIFKVASSDDGGAHWKTVLEGQAKKTAD